MDNLLTYTNDELELRNGVSMPEIWVSYKGKIYDVTSSELFKDGKHYWHHSGKDLTAEMSDAPHIDDVMNKFTIVGILKDFEENNVSSPTIKVGAKNAYNAEVLFVKKRAAEVLEIKLSRPSQFNFIAGQYVAFKLLINDKTVIRTYSIASSPNNSNELQFYIRYFKSGIASEYFFNQLKEKDAITLLEPAGKSFVPEYSDSNVVYICTDVGISPVISALEDALAKHRSGQIYLVYGNRNEKDILCSEKIKSLENQYPAFRYIPVLSREAWHWRAKIGYVHQVYQNLIQENPMTEFFVCGWKKMTDEVQVNLNKAGINQNKIRIQSYS